MGSVVSDSKKNAFDLLRLILTFFVIVTHGYMLGGYDETKEPLTYFSKGQTNLGEVAVMGFFALSGFLITASCERSKNYLVFISHRLLRIFPGFWLSLIITAFVFGPVLFVVTGRPFSNYNLSGQGGAVSYVIHNFLLQVNQWNIKDLLAFDPRSASYNGSLWSLYPELQCYFLTLIAGYFGLFKENRMLYLLVVAIVLVFFAIEFNFDKSYGPTVLKLTNSLKLYPSYLAGSIVYVFKDYLLFDVKGTVFISLFSLLLLRYGGFHLASPLLIALVLINVFQSFQFHLKYDVSFGIYIYSFPIQHLLFATFGSRLNVTVFLFLSFAISGLIGFLSFVLIEKPAISLRKRTDLVLRKISLLDM